MLYKTLRNLAGMCNANQPPCGVLRYADKLPITHNYTWSVDTDMNEFVKGLFSSFMPVSYGLKTAKRKMVGIDLITLWEKSGTQLRVTDQQLCWTM